MRRILIAILFIIFLPVNLFSEDDTYSKFRNILDDLDRVVKSDLKKDLSKKFNFVKNKAMNMEVSFYIDPHGKKSIYGGAGFTPKSSISEKTYIIVSQYMIDLYEKNPSVVLSILLHEHIHAYSFFKDKNYYLFYLNNKIEKFLYEFDANYYEAYFIDACLIPNKYPLTKFEKFLVHCYRKHSLDVFSAYFQMVDYKIAKEFHEIRHKKITIADKMEEIESLGKSVIKNNSIDSGDNEHLKYLKIVSMLTYYNFVSQAVYDIYAMKDSTRIPVKKFSLRKFNKVYSIRQKLNEILTKDRMDFSKRIYKKVRKRYEISY